MFRFRGHVLHELTGMEGDESPPGHDHVLHQFARIRGKREELDTVRLDELAEHRMGCQPHAVAVAHEATGDRKEGLHVAPRADDQDGDRKDRDLLGGSSKLCGRRPNSELPGDMTREP